jgi:hypothetical protein
MAEKRNAFRTLIGFLKERYRLDNRGLVGKIILNWMFNWIERRRLISCGAG